MKSIQCLPGLKVVSSSGQPFSVTFPSLESLVNQRKLMMSQDENFLNNKIPFLWFFNHSNSQYWCYFDFTWWRKHGKKANHLCGQGDIAESSGGRGVQVTCLAKQMNEEAVTFSCLTNHYKYSPVNLRY